MYQYLFTFISLLILGACQIRAADLALTVRPESENKTVNKKAAEETRAHWLIVRVTNASGTKLEGLTLKWTLFAANLQRGADDIIVEKSGDMKFSVDGNGRFTDLTTPQVAFVWAPQHSVKSGSGRRSSFKRVAESGHRYHGYRVQVLNGDSVVSEAYSSEALRRVN